MAVTAYKSPGTTSNETRTDSAGVWQNTDNAKTSNDVWTRVDIGKDDFSDWLRVTNFSMGVPSGATINGIEVQIERYTNNDAIDSAVYLRKTSGQVGDNYASATVYPGSDAIETYGGATDLWNTTWSETDVNHADFGLDLSTLDDASSARVFVDHIQIRVYYTEDAPTGTNISINIADTFKDVDSLQINIGDVWKDVTEVQQNIGDVWKTVF